jgi:hypothetical protein
MCNDLSAPYDFSMFHKFIVDSFPQQGSYTNHTDSADQPEMPNDD